MPRFFKPIRHATKNAMKSTPHNYAIRALLLLCLGCTGSSWGQPRLDRLDFYDKANNALFFVTFEYDGGGKNTGRTVYMSDSTFVRRTVFVNDAAGNRARETSFNFNGDTAGYTTFTTVNTKPTISAFDQFGLEQLGGPVSYGATATNEYDVSQKGATVNKMQYQCDVSNNLMRVNVQDAGGQLLYYAIVNSSTGAITSPHRASPAPSLSVIGSRYCRIRLTIDKPSVVNLDAYTPAGRRVAGILSTICGPGNADISADLAAARIPNGLYLLRVSIDGATALFRRCAIVGIAGGDR